MATHTSATVREETPHRLLDRLLGSFRSFAADLIQDRIDTGRSVQIPFKFRGNAYRSGRSHIEFRAVQKRSW